MLVLKILLLLFCFIGLILGYYLKEKQPKSVYFIPIFGIIGVVAMVFLLVPAESNKKPEVNKDNYEVIHNSLSKLKDFKDDYIVSHILEAPDGNISYLNVNTKGGNYNEYPVDKDGNLGRVDDNADEITYTLTDWLSTDTYYTVTGDDKGSSFAKLPSSYTDIISSRKYMYLDLMLDKFTSIEHDGNSKINLGNGDELIDIYTCKLPSSVVQDILGINTVGMYECIAEEYKDNEDIAKFCGFYLEDTKRNLACSDAVVTLGVDSLGLIRYVGIDVGGLGTRLFYSMTLVTKIDSELRVSPAELSSAIDYLDVIKDYASFVAQYDSYTDALNAMYESDNSTSTEIPSSPTEKPSNEEVSNE